MKKFTFHRNDQPELVNREIWRWVAEYHDGTVLKQFDDETGLFHQFAEIDQENLKVFRMVHDELPAHVLIFEPGMKLIHFYRNVVLDVFGPSRRRLRWYISGYEKDGRKVLTVITPFEVVTTSDPNYVMAE